MKNQLAELIGKYAPLGVMWFDGEWENTWTVARGRETYAMLRQLRPDLIINNRLSKGRPMSGFATAESTVGDFATPEQTTGLFDPQRKTYWESNIISPMPTGEIEPRQVSRLKEIGRCTSKCGRSIYGTRGGPYMPARWGVSTCKGDVIYLHLLECPGDGTMTLSPIEKKVTMEWNIWASPQKE